MVFYTFSYVRGLKIVRKKKMIGKMCENCLKNYVVYGIIMSDIKDEVYDLSILLNSLILLRTI